MTDNQTTYAISICPWGKEYRPVCTATLTGGQEHLHVCLRCEESNPIARETRPNGDVYKDSCLEFFFQPFLSDPRYLNFEFNSLGILHLRIGTGRNDRQNVPPCDFQIHALREKAFWQVDFSIPLAYVEALYGQTFHRPLHRARGNFYKCGDQTPIPHYLCWSPVSLPAPDFHCPAFFGDLLLRLEDMPAKARD